MTDKRIIRLIDLRNVAPLTRDKAYDDLKASAYFHVQPCDCDKCDPKKVCK